MAPAMPKSATEVMQEILFATVVDAMGALRDSAGGLPNRMIGALGAIHANTAHADLPKELQDAIAANVRAAFTRLLKEGYVVTQNQGQPQRPAPSNGPPHGRPSAPPRRPNPGRPDRPRSGGPGRGGKPRPPKG